MTYVEALEVLAIYPHVWRLRELCADSNDDVVTRDAYRRHVVDLAEGRPAPALPRSDGSYVGGGCCPGGGL